MKRKNPFLVPWLFVSQWAGKKLEGYFPLVNHKNVALNTGNLVFLRCFWSIVALKNSGKSALIKNN
jgi:hypothetical protein